MIFLLVGAGLRSHSSTGAAEGWRAGCTTLGSAGHHCSGGMKSGVHNVGLCRAPLRFAAVC